MTSCEKIQEMISAMLDGELSVEERSAVEEHIALCPECAAMYADFSALSICLKEELTSVPADLHSNIMNAVKAQPKKAKIIPLRAYLSAAACLVLVVGAVFSLRLGGADKAAMPAAPAALAEAEVAYGLATVDNVRELPAAPAAPAEPAAPADPAAPPMPMPESATEDRVLHEENGEVYYPGMEIDFATVIFSGKSESLNIDDTATLANLLMDSPAEIEPDAIDGEPSALLELGRGPVFSRLKLYFIGDSVIVETGDTMYMAAGTAEEFLSLK